MTNQKMITQFDPDNLKTLRADIDAALASVAAKHGISLRLGGAKYGSDNFSAKLEGAIIRNGEIISREAQDFTTLAHLYGLAGTDLGREFVNGGQIFKIAGLLVNRPKRPIVATSRGKSFVFTADSVVRALGRKTI